MSRRRTSKGDVSWFLPGGKRPIAYSTVATSDLLAMLAFDGHTFGSALAAINYDDDAKAIVTKFIDKGYGDTPMSDLGVR
jgi:hypothetical protein